MRDDLLNPQAWNLVAGVTLVATGCGARVAEQDGDESGETGISNPESESDESDGTECGECPIGYYCIDGECMYQPAPDGWTPYYECYADYECGDFSLCEFGYCTSEDPPPPDCEDPGLALPVPVDIDDEVLALTFADVDEDGHDELVLATQSELLTHDSDGTLTVSAREPGPITAMIAGVLTGNFMPGDDVMLLVGDSQTVLYASNGDGSFAAALSSGAPHDALNGLTAGTFYAAPLTDMLGWGAEGAYITQSGAPVVVTGLALFDGAVHDLDSPDPGFALRGADFINFYTFELQLVTSVMLEDWGPPVIAAFARGTEAMYLNMINYDTWTRVEARTLDSAVGAWSIYGTPERLFAGDLDGDGNDELLFFDNDLGTAIEVDAMGSQDCWLPVPIDDPIDAAFGDHDGDGDEELAIVTALGEVTMIDGG